MRRSPLCRTLCIIAVFALFAAPVSLQAGVGASDHRDSSGAVLSQTVSQLWGFLSGLWAKNGCRLDPSGHCIPGTSAPGDNGCIIDPSGQCATSPVTAKNGCRLDPDGRCLP
jgi:hypothetical protein